MRRWVVAGNWKMNTNSAEAVSLAKSVREAINGIEGGEIILSPPYVYLASVYNCIKGSPITLAAQNMYSEDKGAYTGEISPAMLKDVGCSHVIIGHSERRKLFHESDESVNVKVKKALSAGLKPIICMGETENERERGITEFVVGIQVKKALAGVEKLDNIILAYEPVWAIGTGKNATPMEAEEVHHFIRNVVGDTHGDACKTLQILYGGSVTADNMGDLIRMKNIDGALIGGASLKSESFLAIIRHVMEKRK